MPIEKKLPMLSKSDYQLASGCAKKLVYKKEGYPTTNDTNEYMEMLAQGGYIVGKMATLYYEDGIEIEGTTKECVQQTLELLKQDHVTLFEAAIQSGQKIVRIDILIKRGQELQLIEVKSKSYASNDPKSIKQLDTYIEDVAYQYHVLSEQYPNHNISSFLFLPDKCLYTEIDGLAGWFSIEPNISEIEDENPDIITQQQTRFKKPVVRFKYEHHQVKEYYVAFLKRHRILTQLNITDQVKALQPVVEQKAARYLRILNQGIANEDFKISKDCKACEFNTPNESQNGYAECWGNIAYQDHHIFDLFFGGAVKNTQKEYYWNELINQEKTHLFDIDTAVLRGDKDELGKRAHRQLLQIQKTKENTEWKSEALHSFIDSLKYPLHFIDFETYTGSVPFHKNMRPYEIIAFQWSCHTIPYKGATPIHKEWIHTGSQFPDSNAFPNIEFARALMKHIGYTGTAFMWATHENTVLSAILNQIVNSDNKDPELEKWLTDITSDKASKRKGRLIDMNQLTIQYYFHPYMKGRTSIKKVLPAIWSHFPYLHQVPHFSKYSPDNWNTGIIDPYDNLKALNNVEDIDSDDVVAGGTDAMRAYQRIRFDSNLSQTQRASIRNQLLEYCKLDTMAMVIIAYHWGIR
ncbi:DUF2779 domain-containing protein [Phnomibacter ginsenosidimutans]|uniref:DUF2779 domain-containing protein n=1 Tax=Phnomibacter ginsenosidimutans TaxID=2676868 RepID=A0A6I6GKF1_9BACT|nr:DUF2779 domain-containing protein [Phnomibacter ginsenosidimutans]QGW28915.1 DUF2779 domain-containing protein [Phnomibacter ginsenosidimutans]